MLSNHYIRGRFQNSPLNNSEGSSKRQFLAMLSSCTKNIFKSNRFCMITSTIKHFFEHEQDLKELFPKKDIISLDCAFSFYFGQFLATNVAGVAWQRAVIFLMILQYCRKKMVLLKPLTSTQIMLEKYTLEQNWSFLMFFIIENKIIDTKSDHFNYFERNYTLIIVFQRAVLNLAP